MHLFYAYFFSFAAYLYIFFSILKTGHPVSYISIYLYIYLSILLSFNPSIYHESIFSRDKGGVRGRGDGGVPGGDGEPGRRFHKDSQPRCTR